MNWYYLIPIILIIWGGVEAHLHNRTAARKGENPHSFNFTFGRNSFRKDPEPPYTEDRRINRHWKP